MAAKPVDAYHEASTSKGDSKKKLDHLEVKIAKNGGHVVEHHYDNSGPGIFAHRPDPHAFTKGPETIHHLMDHLGVSEDEMIAHLEGGHEGMDAEEAGGKAKGEEASKEKKPAHKGRSKAAEKGAN